MVRVWERRRKQTLVHLSPRAPSTTPVLNRELSRAMGCTAGGLGELPFTVTVTVPLEVSPSAVAVPIGAHIPSLGRSEMGRGAGSAVLKWTYCVTVCCWK